MHNCIRQVLEYYGVEHAHLLVNTNFRFQILKPRFSNTYYIKYENDQELLIGLFNNYIKFNYNQNDSATDVWKRNIASLEKGKPVIVGVDPYYLPYDTNYRKIHTYHMLILCGYYKTSKEVVVIDVGERVKYKGTVSLNQFILARNSVNPKGENLFSGTPINNSYIEMDMINSRQVDYRLLIIQTLENALKYFMDFEEDIEKGHSTKYLFAMMEKLTFADASLNVKIIDKIYNDIYILTCKKRLFSLYLEITKQKLNIDTQKANNKMMKIIFNCEIIYNLLIKVKFSQSDKTYSKFLYYFQNTMNLEMELKDDIQELLDMTKKSNLLKNKS